MNLETFIGWALLTAYQDHRDQHGTTPSQRAAFMALWRQLDPDAGLFAYPQPFEKRGQR